VHEVRSSSPLVGASSFSARLRGALRREWCFARALWRRLGGRLGALLVLLLVGGALFRHYEPDRVFSYVQAVYYTLSLVFGNPPEDYPTPVALQVLFFALPVLGLTVLVGSVVEVAEVLRGRRQNDRMWSAAMAESMSNHVILVGLGRVGWRSYCVLRGFGVPLVVIVLHEEGEFVADARRAGTPVLVGDARRDALLEAAGVRRARALIAATNDDLANLEMALDARRLHDSIRVVLRMFDQTMANKVKDRFAIPAAWSSAALAGPTFAASAVTPNFVASTVVDQHLVVMVTHVVAEGSAWCGRTLAEIGEADRVVFVKLERSDGEARMFPPPSTALRAGDSVVVQGLYDDLLRLAVA